MEDKKSRRFSFASISGGFQTPARPSKHTPECGTLTSLWGAAMACCDQRFPLLFAAVFPFAFPPCLAASWTPPPRPVVMGMHAGRLAFASHWGMTDDR